MALDEPKTNDEITRAGGYTFVMDKDTAGFTGNVTIELTARGIEIYSGVNRGRSKGCSK